MCNGREGLAGIVREVMGHNPKCYDEAFIFYSKDYRKVKILHYDINGYVMYQKWFDSGKFLKPEFANCFLRLLMPILCSINYIKCINYSLDE